MQLDLLRADWLAGRPVEYKRPRRQYVGSLIIYAMLSDVSPHYLYLYVGSLVGRGPGKRHDS